MSVESMVGEGLYLMVTGMVFVVMFLTILVLILNQIEKFTVAEEVEQPASSDSQLDQSKMTAVISAAILKHRQRHRK